MNSSKINFRLVNIFFFAITVLINFISVVYKIGGKSIKELSDKYDNLFTPSSSTFAIWSLIYLLMFVFLVVQFLSRNNDSVLVKTAYFSLSCLFNFSWIVAWQYEFIFLSLLIMAGLLAVLVKINYEIKTQGQEFFKLVFGIYLGWICIATIANATAFLVSLGFDFNIQFQVVATILVLLIGVAIVFWTMYRLSNFYLAISVSWALLGIYQKRAGDFPLIANFSVILTAVVSIYVLFNLNQIIKKAK